MIEHKGDLWSYFKHPGHRIAISTNGFVKRNGEAVMGRGCAKQAMELYPQAPRLLAEHIAAFGNTPGFIILNSENSLLERVMVLPVKHNWWEQASLDLVRVSVAYLDKQADENPDWIFHVPRLGCGNGKLHWTATVLPLMKNLPNNVVVHH